MQALHFHTHLAPASSQEPAPSIYEPITPLTGRQLELLLLGCRQASRPPRCDGFLDQIVVEVVHDDDLQLHRLSTFVTKAPALQVVREDAVNTKLYSQLGSSTPIHDPCSQIAPPLIPTSSITRYRTIQSRRSTHSFDFSLRQSACTRTRSLTAAIDGSFLNMTTITSIPGSPPDLSGSRSSKSSSYCSTSRDSNQEGIAADVTNFEEIGLDDDEHGKPEGPRVSSTQRSRAAEPAITSTLSNGSRPALPSLQNQVRDAVKQKENGYHVNKGSSFASLRRGVSSPIYPFTTPGARPRSNSPPKRVPRPHSSAALSADSPRPQLNSSQSSLPQPPRRGSWQQRKSIQELEEEYHDSDDELPEDASLWNVPVSPHVGDRSARSSFHGSPAREPILRSPRPIPLTHATSVPETQPPLMRNGQSQSKLKPAPPRSSSLSASLSSPSSPHSKRLHRAGRARSWNLAMEDLSEEAKVISEALEYHAAESRRARLKDGQANSSSESVSESGVTPKAHQIQLPPIQKGNLDFMPISKEKEAILSRTRPSWLPPKDPREEKRHLKEYQRMMAASLEAEKKKQDQERSQESDKEITRDALNRIWHYYCEETTDLSAIDQRVFDLCWRGISPKVRGKVWQRAIGNPLGLTRRSFDKALARAQEIQSQDTGHLGKHERRMNGWFRDIERDAETAFPELNLFHRNGPLWQDLIDVCKAYACYRSDIGYLYGQQLTAALLLLQVHNPADTFILLANCFNRTIPLAFQSSDISTTARTYNHAVSTIAIKFPRLHEYLFGSIEEGGLGFTAELIFEPMLRTLFCNGLDIDRLCRFWDLWAFEGDKAVVRTAVAILGCVQSQIFEIQGDVDLRRRNIQETLAWGPFNRAPKGGHWDLGHIGEDKFVDEVRMAGELNYRLK
jgi:Rab-GTPase-TBC domain